MSSVPGDQTRGDSTPFIAGGGSVALSRNEVAALCLKAARGAGMSWGLAEEAGFAASWLTAHGFDGPGELRAHLDEAQGRAWEDLCPDIAPGAWRAAAPDRPLCPIALGATLCDHAALPAGPCQDRPLALGPVDHPLLLLPFLDTVAQAQGVVLSLDWDGGRIVIGGPGVGLRDAGVFTQRRAVELTLSATPGTVRDAALTPAPRIAAETVAALNAFALRTTVPPSAASRAGAGSAGSDND
ncbi:MAG: DUF3726 domain-containing protein [Rhodobacteraceae bacterium]|nr:DUF3726 domain-containing protein [Paracoccaceae bacterium]